MKKSLLLFFDRAPSRCCNGLEYGWLVMITLLICTSIHAFGEAAGAADIVVQGKVVDEQNAPIPGVSVLVKGSLMGTTTDTEGNYSIKVRSQDDVLVFSFIGYATQEIPVGSQQYPDDWKSTWFNIQKKWSDEVGCPDGVFTAFDIDAKINAAYIVLGLLYGNGDFTKTMEVSTRAGQDSDCNPSSAGGILGTMLGYEKIPAYWKMGLKDAEDIDFKYTTMSLNDVYAMGFQHALKVIERNGGKVAQDSVTIKVQKPETVRLEQGFKGHVPVEKRTLNETLKGDYTFEFEGIGFVILGESEPVRGSSWDYKGDYFATVDLYIDDKKIETAKLPANYIKRRHELFWKYQLTPGKHTVTIKQINPDADFAVRLYQVVIYDNKPKNQQ